MKKLIRSLAKYAPNLALLAVASLFSLAIGELLCRVVPQYNDTNPVYLLPHSTLPFTMLPNSSAKTILGHSININGQGFRDSEHSLEKGAGVIRIIALGDSITYGYGVEARDTYPKIIEQLLNNDATRRRYEVFNYGHTAYDVVDYYNLFETTGLKYKPDILVVGLTSSDFTREQYKEVIRDGVGMRPGSVWTTYHVPAFVLRILRKSALYLTTGNALKRLSASRRTPERPQDKLQELIETKARVSQCLSKFNALAGSLKIPIIYAFFPKQSEVVGGAVDHPEFIEIIASMTRGGSVRFVNLMGDIQAFKDAPQEVFIQQDWVHPTPRGHSLYAKRIASEIEKLKISNSARTNWPRRSRSQ